MHVDTEMQQLLTPLQWLEWKYRTAVTIQSEYFPWDYRITKAVGSVTVFQRRTHASLTRLFPHEIDESGAAERALRTVRSLLADEIEFLQKGCRVEQDLRSGKTVKRLIHQLDCIESIEEAEGIDSTFVQDVLEELTIADFSTQCTTYVSSLTPDVEYDFTMSLETHTPMLVFLSTSTEERIPLGMLKVRRHDRLPEDRLAQLGAYLELFRRDELAFVRRARLIGQPNLPEEVQLRCKRTWEEVLAPFFYEEGEEQAQVV